MADQTVYTVGGTVVVGTGTYIKRNADEELLELCRSGELAFVLAPRQIGKSSLMANTTSELKKENIPSVNVDFSKIGVDVSIDQWYLGILDQIKTTLKLKIDIYDWWARNAELGPAQRLIVFFRDTLLKEIGGKIVLFFDEIDSTLSLRFSSDDFYAALRAIYNDRSSNPDFNRLSFVLLGVATPNQLITDVKRTPFNIGRRVELDDFTKEEALPLIRELGGNTEQILEWIFQFTGGHPYLTQRICKHLARSNETINQQVIAHTVTQLFTGDQAKQDSNLQFVNDMLLRRSPNVRKVLEIYKNIRSNDKEINDDELSILKTHLKLSGLVRSENGKLQVRNEIYNTIFDLNWIQENIPRDWAKVAKRVFIAVSLFVLLGFIINVIVWALSLIYVGDFYSTQLASDKLKDLARLFSLRGVFPNDDYDFKARELFYNPNWSWNNQSDLFQVSNLALTNKKKYLPRVVKGLYVTMANVGSEDDSSELLGMMRDSLREIDDSESLGMYDEISLWLEARGLTDQGAFDKYSQAIVLNNANPATHYERAIVAIRLEEYETTLLDLEMALGLANDLFEEKLSSLPQQALPDGNYYRSSFYSIEDVRKAIDLVIQENLQDTNFTTVLILAKTEANKYTNLESAGLLRTVNKLVGEFATQISMAQTQGSEIQAQKSTVEAQSTDAQIQVLTATAQVSKAQEKVSTAEAQAATAQALVSSVMINTTSYCRSGTSTRFSNTVQIPQGERAVVIGRNDQNDWLWISWTDQRTQKNYECWISAELVKFDPKVVPLTPTPLPPTPNPVEIGPDTFRILAAKSVVTCKTGDTCGVHMTVRNPPPGTICVYVQPRNVPGQNYWFQFKGLSGTANIGASPDESPFAIFAVSISSSDCPQDQNGQVGSLPSGTSTSTTVKRINQ